MTRMSVSELVAALRENLPREHGEGGRGDPARQNGVWPDFESVAALLTMATLEARYSDVPDRARFVTPAGTALELDREGGCWRITRALARAEPSFTDEAPDGLGWLADGACRALGVVPGPEARAKMREVLQWAPGSFAENFRAVHGRMSSNARYAVAHHGRRMADLLGFRGVPAHEAVKEMAAADIDFDAGMRVPYALALEGDVEFLREVLRRVEPDAWLLVAAAEAAPAASVRVIAGAFAKKLSDDETARLETVLVSSLVRAASRWRGGTSPGDRAGVVNLKELEMAATAFREMTVRFPSLYADPEAADSAASELTGAMSSLPADAPSRWVLTGVRAADTVLAAAARAVIGQSAYARLEEAGWKMRYVEDGHGEPGWYAYTGDDADPDLETGLCRTQDDAARVALETWPSEFGRQADTAPSV